MVPGFDNGLVGMAKGQTSEAIMNLNSRKDIGSINFREVAMIGKVDPHTSAINSIIKVLNCIHPATITEIKNYSFL